MAKKKQTIRTDASNDGGEPKSGGIDLRAIAEKRGLISHDDDAPVAPDEIEVVGLDSDEAAETGETSVGAEEPIDKDRKSTRMNSSHGTLSRMPSSA